MTKKAAKAEKQTQKCATFYISEKLRADLKKLADSQHRSISKTIVSLVTKAVDDFKNTK